MHVLGLRHDRGVLVLVGEHWARVENCQSILPVLHCDIDPSKPRPGTELAGRRDCAAICARESHLEPLIPLIYILRCETLPQQELCLSVEHDVVHRRVLERLVQDANTLYLLVAHEQYLSQQGGDFNILRAQLLKEVDG